MGFEGFGGFEGLWALGNLGVLEPLGICGCWRRWGLLVTLWALVAFEGSGGVGRLLGLWGCVSFGGFGGVGGVVSFGGVGGSGGFGLSLDTACSKLPQDPWTLARNAAPCYSSFFRNVILPTDAFYLRDS